MDNDLEHQALEAWDKLMMVILEMLARAYGKEREAETFDALVPVDRADMERMALQVFEDRIGRPSIEFREIKVGAANDIPPGERRILNVDKLCRSASFTWTKAGLPSRIHACIAAGRWRPAQWTARWSPAHGTAFNLM